MKTRKKAKRVSPENDVLDHVGDNSHLHIRFKPDLLCAPPPFIVETVLFSKVGHTFGPGLPALPGSPPSYVVQDFLLDQTGASGADGKMSSLKSFDLTTATSYRFNIFPKDRSKRIKVVPPASGQVFIGLNVGRRFVNAVSDVADAYTAHSYFIELVGATPVFTYNYFFIGRNTNHWVWFEVYQQLVSPISFFGFTTIGSYPPRAFDPGIKSYTTYSTGLPLNLPGPDAVPFMMFSYLTQSSNDPGPFVFLG